MNERWAEVDHYIDDTLVGQDPGLRAALTATAAEGLPPINVSPSQGKLLNLIARIQRATRILEVGTLAGYSTIWLARALPEDGRIVTLEIDPHHAEVARANVAFAGVGDQVEIQVGAAVDSLARMVDDGVDPFDLVFIDADKPSNLDYVTFALQLTRPGSVIIVDNVVRNGEVIDPDGDANVQGVRRLFEAVSGNPHLSATAIQTVGSKGYDGFLIGVVAGDERRAEVR